MKNLYYYTVYLANSDEIIASGTTIECAKQMGKTINGFHSMVSKNTLGVQKKYTVVKEKVFVDNNGNILEDDE